MCKSRANVFALIWGFAEATVFFIVPDVLLSWYALSDRKRALIACNFALAGALTGGTLMWLTAHFYPAEVHRVLTGIPAINVNMIAEVENQLTDAGIYALFIGPVIGVPYKIYAFQSANLDIAFWVFLAVSIPARLTRFILVTLAIGRISRSLQRRYSLNSLRKLHVAGWFVFYLWYFAIMPL